VSTSLGGGIFIIIGSVGTIRVTITNTADNNGSSGRRSGNSVVVGWKIAAGICNVATAAAVITNE